MRGWTNRGPRPAGHCPLGDEGTSATKALSNPDSDLTPVMDDLKDNVEDFGGLARRTCFPTNAYPGNVFKNGSRVAKLLSDASL